LGGCVLIDAAALGGRRFSINPKYAAPTAYNLPLGRALFSGVLPYLYLLQKVAKKVFQTIYIEIFGVI